MSEDIKTYKCPCCGATLSFNAAVQNMKCEFCDSEFSVEDMMKINELDGNAAGPSKYDWDNYEERKYETVETHELSNYTCPSCGAEITGDETLGATVCPYCGNDTIVKESFTDALRPDYMIPFKIDKKKAMECFEQAASKVPFLPNEFKDKKKIEEMAGVYVPFWTFDCNCHADLVFDGTKTTAWSDFRYNYVKTDHYRLYRTGDLGFEHVPVDGSKKTSDTYMEALEPFDYSEAVEFNSAFLSGFLADKFDVTAEESRPRANERIQASTVNAFRQSTMGFTDVNLKSSKIDFTDGKTRYCLLPVWMLNIKYNDVMYKYAINGQTGKVVGEYPNDSKKKWLHFAKIFGISIAVLLLLFKLIGLI